jgi:hypothetical protein
VPPASGSIAPWTKESPLETLAVIQSSANSFERVHCEGTPIWTLSGRRMAASCVPLIDSCPLFTHWSNPLTLRTSCSRCWSLLTMSERRGLT